MQIGLGRLAAIAAVATSLGLTATSSYAEKITVSHWGSNFYGAPYAVAMAKGWFKEEGVDIDGILTSTGGGTSVRNTLAGGLPYGEVALPAAIKAIRAGEDLLIVNAGAVSIADVGWIAKKDSTLEGVAALKGKKVAYTSPGSVSDMLIRMAFEKAGLKPDEATLIAAGGAGANLTAALQGAVDAAVTSEPLWSQNKNDLHAVFWVKDVLDPHMTQTVGVTTREFATQHPDELRAIIRARKRGVEFIYAHPDEAAEITAEAYHMDVEDFRAAFQNFVSFGYWGEGRLDRDGMNRMVEGMRLVGQIKGEFDWTPVISEDFLAGAE